MPIKIRDLRRTLTGKLHSEADEGGNHSKYKIRHNGRVIGMTVLSRSIDEVDDKLASKIAGQLGIERAFLMQLVECRWSYEDYARVAGSNPRRE